MDNRIEDESKESSLYHPYERPISQLRKQDWTAIRGMTIEECGEPLVPMNTMPEVLIIVRQSTLKAVADLFSGKGDPERLGAYLALADQMTEWCMTGTVSPRISKEERKNLVIQFGSVEGARFVAMNACSVPFLHLLTKAQYDALLGGPARTSPRD